MSVGCCKGVARKASAMQSAGYGDANNACSTEHRFDRGWGVEPEHQFRKKVDDVVQ